MDDAKKELIYAILILFGLAIIWAYTGGPQRPSSKSGPFLERPLEKEQQALLRETKSISSGGEKTPQEEISTESAYKYKALIESIYGAKSSDPQKEYIKIRASLQNDEALPISRWSLEGRKGLRVKLGKGSYLPYSGRINPQREIVLYPGETAYIITGRSPIGTSFKLNKCTGYFSQFQDFFPSLPKECPRPKDEPLPKNLDDKCLDYIERLPRCEIPLNLPYGLSSECTEYITENINYQSCVASHKGDSDFYKKEWRIYLGREEELWKNKRETIILYDEKGKIVDWKSY